MEWSFVENLQESIHKAVMKAKTGADPGGGGG